MMAEGLAGESSRAGAVSRQGKAGEACTGVVRMGEIGCEWVM